MRTIDFIARCAEGKQVRDKRCASVFFESRDCIIYSYGYHYPLLFKIAGAWIVNDRGYSATTGKHISLAGQVADYRVSLNEHGIGISQTTAENVRDSAVSELQDIRERLEKLSVRAFRQRANLQYRQAQLTDTLSFINSVIKA
jgi:hypothetical protein